MTSIPRDQRPWPGDCSKIRSDILRAAEAAITGDRENAYGAPEDSFATIAEFWTTYLKVVQPCLPEPLKPWDVAAMLGLLKTARIAHSGGSHLDSWIDLAGYASCGAESYAQREDDAKSQDKDAYAWAAPQFDRAQWLREGVPGIDPKG